MQLAASGRPLHATLAELLRALGPEAGLQLLQSHESIAPRRAVFGTEDRARAIEVQVAEASLEAHELGGQASDFITQQVAAELALRSRLGLHVVLTFYEEAAAAVLLADPDRRKRLSKLCDLVLRHEPRKSPTVLDAVMLARAGVTDIDTVIVSNAAKLTVTSVGVSRQRMVKDLQRCIDDCALSLDKQTQWSAIAVSEWWLAIAREGGGHLLDGQRVWTRDFDRVFVISSRGPAHARVIELADRGHRR